MKLKIIQIATIMLITSNYGLAVDKACPECGENRANCKTRGGPIEGIDIIPLNKEDVTELEIGLMKMLFEKAKLDFFQKNKNLSEDEFKNEYKKYLEKQVSKLHVNNLEKAASLKKLPKKTLKFLKPNKANKPLRPSGK